MLALKRHDLRSRVRVFVGGVRVSVHAVCVCQRVIQSKALVLVLIVYEPKILY